MMIRDPVQRAYSAWKHESARGFEDQPFPVALDLEAKRLEEVGTDLAIRRTGASPSDTSLRRERQIRRPHPPLPPRLSAPPAARHERRPVLRNPVEVCACGWWPRAPQAARGSLERPEAPTRSRSRTAPRRVRPKKPTTARGLLGWKPVGGLNGLRSRGRLPISLRTSELLTDELPGSDGDSGPGVEATGAGPTPVSVELTASHRHLHPVGGGCVGSRIPHSATAIMGTALLPPGVPPVGVVSTIPSLR